MTEPLGAPTPKPGPRRTLLAGALTDGALLGPFGCGAGFLHGLVASGIAWHSAGPSEAAILLLALAYAALGFAVGAGGGAMVAGILWAVARRGRSP